MAIDLRSDTVTKPTEAMREAIATADVGDDVYGEDPTVNALESDVARMFGHAAALFVPTGTMGNQIAMALHVKPGEELLCDADAHVVTYERGAAAALFGISSRTIVSKRGLVDPQAYAEQVREHVWHVVGTSAIAVENTHNRGGGLVQPIDALRALREVADSTGDRVALHCDGARIWNAHVASGVPLNDYGALFDTLSVCLSKGLGAPVGSVLISTADRIARAREIRGRLGGNMRQAGVLAAAGRYALAHHIDRIADDHTRARRLAVALEPYDVVDPAAVETNIVVLDLPANGPDATAFAALAADRGVLVSAFGPRRVRLVTHLDVNDADIDFAIDALAKVLADS